MGSWSSKPVVLPPIAFDGDDITFSVKRLLVEDMMLLSNHFKDGKMVFESPMQVCETAAKILPKYVTAIEGMSTADGAMTLEQFTEATAEFYFVPLIGELFAKLITVSTVGGQAKNSVPPSPN